MRESKPVPRGLSAYSQGRWSLLVWGRVQLGSFADAIAFMTRIRVPGAMLNGVESIERATTLFPLIGVIVGLAGGAAFGMASYFWPPVICAVISTAVTIWVTGALHEDGLADAADGFGGGSGREQTLAIMKDSRVGSYAVVTLGLVMLGKVAAITIIATSMGTAALVYALIAAHTLGRWTALPLLRIYPYARAGQADGKSAPFARGATTARLVAGTVIMILVVALSLGWRGAIAIAVSTFIVLMGGCYFARRIGGITGDCLGAVNQLAELTTYLVLSANRLP